MKEIKQINKIKDDKEEFDYYEVVNDDGSVTTGIKDFHWQYKEIEKELRDDKKRKKKKFNVKTEVRDYEEIN